VKVPYILIKEVFQKRGLSPEVGGGVQFLLALGQALDKLVILLFLKNK
jgi:hypothetical protein